MMGIADTGFLVAFGNQDDTYHGWALSIAKEVHEPLLTCEAVLAEAAFQLRSVAYVLSLVEDQMVRVAFNASRHWEQLHKLAKKYADHKPDFADICLIRMSELFPALAVITVDERDFRTYRRNGREAIPLICPSTRS